MFSIFFEGYGDHRDLHVLTHSFPTRRSSDLEYRCQTQNRQAAGGRPGTAFSVLPIAAQMAQDIEDRFGHFTPVAHAQLGVRAKPMRQRGISRIFPLQDFARSEEHTSELQSLMRISYAVFCLK